MPVTQAFLIAGDGHALVLFDTRDRYLYRESLSTLYHPLMRITRVGEQAFSKCRGIKGQIGRANLPIII